MKELSSLPLDSRPVVTLVGDPSGLALSLVENFLANFCRVKIYSTKDELWNSSLTHVGDKRGIEIYNITLLDENLETDYFVAIFEDSSQLYIKEKLSLVGQLQKNSLVVLPYSLTGELAKELEFFKNLYQTNKSILGLIFVGEAIGPRANLNTETSLHQSLKTLITKNRVFTSKDDSYSYPLETGKAAKEIVRRLFSFGGVSQKTALLGSAYRQKDIKSLFQKLKPGVEVEETGKKEPIHPEVDEEKVLSGDLKILLKETIEWYKTHPLSESGEKDKEHKKEKIPEPKAAPVEKSPSPVFEKIDLPDPKLSLLEDVSFPSLKFPFQMKKTLAVVLLAFIVLISPYFFLSLSASSLLVTRNNITSGSEYLAKGALVVSRASARTATSQLSFYSSVPLVGNAFEGGKNIGLLLTDLTNLTQRGFRMKDNLELIGEGLLGEESYNLSMHSSEVALELDSIYRELAYLEGELKEGGRLTNALVLPVFERLDLKEIRAKILQARVLFSELPEVLGSEGQKRYLVLFQNNMELRPTGGFIGSFALVNFENGVLKEVEVQDVYSADGQLRGHVEPPDPIREHLGEANWYLRDSNWDPDFPTSAERAEWFLDKEIGVSVDGVIGIDLEVAKGLVSILGPIKLEDFDREVTAKNLYEVTQYEVEENFFPGSRKKANFLTALSREVLLRLESLEKDKHLEVSRVVYNSLEGKHIQIFLHNKEAQNAISELKWDGAVYQPTCSGNCFADYMGVVEANVGVNKSNYFIEREADLDVSMQNGLVKHALSVRFRNTANPVVGVSGRYKNYMRVLAPRESEFLDVEIVKNQQSNFINPDVREVRGRKEGGVLIEVQPQEEVLVVFRWENLANLSLDESGEYRFVWRKQAGVDTIPSEVSFNLPEGMSVEVLPQPSLTQAQTYSYNTLLARDFSARIFW